MGAIGEAQAGAWTLAKEQKISTNAIGFNDELAIGEDSLFIEQPLNASVALVVAPWVEYRTQAGFSTWRGEAVLALKTPLDTEGDQVSALQIGLVWRSDLETCSETGVELRWLGGSRLPLGEHGGFANIEAGVRAHDSGCAGLRLDFTAGYRPADNWLALAQLFSDTPEGREDSLKAQLSLVRFGPEGRGVQLGLRAPVDGDEGPVMLVLGLWS